MKIERDFEEFFNTIGVKYVGEYKDGKDWNGTYYDNKGGKEYKLVNEQIE
jgi:hypothetical protein